MASYSIEWKTSASKELQKLPKPIIAKLTSAVDDLAKELPGKRASLFPSTWNHVKASFDYFSTYYVLRQVLWYTVTMPRPSKTKPETLDLGITPLGPRLAKLRKLCGFSQYSLADVMGISRKQIADYERGIAHPNDEMVVRLAVTLKVSTDTLLGLKGIDLPEETPSVRFTKRLRDLEQLPESKKRAVIKILDEFTRPQV